MPSVFPRLSKALRTLIPVQKRGLRAVWSYESINKKPKPGSQTEIITYQVCHSRFVLLQFLLLGVPVSFVSLHDPTW